MADWSMINAKTVYGANGSSYWRTILLYHVDNNYSNTQAKITFQYGLHLSKELHSDHTYTKGYDTTYVTCTGCTKKTYSPSGTLSRSNTNQGDDIAYCSASYFLITKGTSAKTVTLSAYINHPKTYSAYVGTSTAKVSITISALPKYTISFNKNASDSVTNMPSSITKYYGKNVTVPSTKPSRSGWSFKWWNTSSGGGGTTYKVGATYKANSGATLYAQWGAVNPPTCDTGNITFSTNTDYIIRGFTDISVDVSNIVKQTGRTVTSIQMFINDVGSNVITSAGTLTISGASFASDDDGESAIYIETTDSAGAVGRYFVRNVNIYAPSWARTLEFPTTSGGDDATPQVTPKGLAVIDEVLVYNYTTSTYDSLKTNGLEYYIDTDNNVWGFEYIFDEDHVSDPTDDTPTVDVKITYNHVSTKEKRQTSAFYSTTRNQNYSNGIYNEVFVGGVDNEEFTEYSSRVWWCAINNPLYFPDTNYSEVGSNDTSVVGLTKVGDYLCAVKQSKTTDTAIYLLYPTSFEEETTFAIKQGVQGVGALAKYSFNILGDETLFLSPKGVVAIVPTEDEEHKVQNRSYFVDGRLLKEDEIEQAYSFVYDGKYYLAIGNGIGSVYVLDGNQRNSWGNDKTNLVYECYYLENVPAKCFVKFGGELAFSDGDNVCIFGDSYIDAFDTLTGEESVPVKARWSTLLDDDNALHYNKNLQKKGNLVSVLPVENEIGYKQVAIDEDTFNESKTSYYTFDGTDYIQCTNESVYSANETYYVISRSATKVYIRKDNDDPLEIKRTFNQSSMIPSELFMKKKIKKYKRLQFILVNEESEDFGVDSIVKNYTLGNYAKK